MSGRLPARPWRLIIDEMPWSGAWNMALDRALQLAHADEDTPPVLRLYDWARPTVTIGRFQDPASLDLDRCRAEGVDVSRRFTGGRGVLHDDEVTYSIIAGVADGIPRGTTASYRVLCGALVNAYRLLGVEAELTPRARGAQGSAACYLHSTSADLSLGARKLSGSAQVWFRDTVLQHGSFVISRDVDREAALFGLGEHDRSALAHTTATLAGSGCASPSRTAVRTAAVEGVCTAFGVELVASSFSDDEIDRAGRLLPEVLVAGETEPGPTRAGGVRSSAVRGSG